MTHRSLLKTVDGRLNAGALHVFQRISSFEKNPAKIGTPQIASQPVTIVANVIGMYFLQTAHAAHVLLVMHAVDHGTRTEEEQCFEKRVRDDVKDRGDKRTDSASQEHVTELRDRRVSQNFLDVVLRETDRCGEERGRGADNCDDKHRRGRVNEDLRATHDHVDAGSHHRRSMNQC